MPCMSYEDDDVRDTTTEKKLLENNDRLARISCKILNVLESLPDTSIFKELMENDEINDWYTKHKKEDERRKKQAEKNKIKNKLKELALAKLTPEEIAAFGLKPISNKRT